MISSLASEFRSAPPNRLRVVFYNPKAVFFTMPLGPLAVASHLDKNRYEVVIIDGRLESDPSAAVVEALKGALCLGVSVLTGAPIHDSIAVSRAARAAFPGLAIVWGGWHPSLFAEGCLQEKSVDVTVQAQGEETFQEILQRLEEGRTLEGCAGCTFRAPDGRVIKNPPRILKDVNALARHDYDLLPVERFFALKGKRQLDYIASQGCFFRCAFCADPYVYGRKWVGLEPQRIGEELESLWNRYRFDDVNFQDETYFTYPDRVHEIASEFIRRKLPITWAATMRADQGDRLSEEIMAACRKSGLRRLIIGVESGSQETMDLIQKDIKLEQVFASAEKCARHGVAVNFPFIVCFPNESDASLAASIEVAKRLRSISPNFQTPFYYFKPYPGTPLTDQAIRDGFKPAETLGEWGDFDWYQTGPWVTPERERLIERFKFYQQIAFDRPRPWQRPLQKLARWRCANDNYKLPLEMLAMNALAPTTRLS